MQAPPRMREALVRHTYELLPSALQGAVLAATLFAVGVGMTDQSGPLRLWVPVQILSLGFNFALFVAFKKGHLLGNVTRAQWLRRAGSVATGLSWALAGVLWPMQYGYGPWLGAMLCIAGILSGGSGTITADPRGYFMLAVAMITPPVLLTHPQYWWTTALLVAYTVATCRVVVRNSKVLKESFALRWENEELLLSALDAQAHAEQSEQAKTRFLAAASHDLRQPVQALSLFSDILGSHPDPKKREHAAIAIRRSTDALQAMLEALLDISRLDSGLVTASPGTVHLDGMFAEVEAALADEAEAKGMVVIWAGPSLSVEADSVLLSRVLHNLAANAVRHGGQGRVLLSARRRGDHALVQVWNQGNGIPLEDRARIFEEFVQLRNPERARQQGLGLGLPMVQRICALCGWELDLRSEVSRGSVFSVRLPLADPAASPKETPRHEPDARSRVFLLVEDDELVRDALAEWVETRGGEAHSVRNGDEALEICARAPAFDVVIADYRLPGSHTGAEVIDRIRHITGRNTPSILLSGDAEVMQTLPQDRSSLTVLTKPVTGTKLSDAIGQLTAKRVEAAQ